MNLRHIDLMITEGTNISKETSLNVPYLTEQALVPAFVEAFKKYKYVFLLASSSQLDRIASFSRCVPSGRYMITDRYQYGLMQVYDEDRDEEFKSNKVLYDSEYVLEKAEKAGFGRVVRSNHSFQLIVKDFFERHTEDTCLIYSMWSGYINKLSDVKTLVDYAGDNLIRSHVSGHVTKEDLERAINIVKPEKLVIHHTSVKKEKCCIEVPKSTEIVSVEDGEVVELKTCDSYKDKPGINNISREEANLKDIAKICKEAFESENPQDILKKKLRNKWENEKPHKATHEICAKCQTDRITEKRICRCMNYYDENAEICDEEHCKLKLKWKNVGDITVSDYEKPTEYVMEKVGGMDLILDEHYAVEVKPYDSEETLSRMFAEILTYTIDGEYEPGIAMFKYNHEKEEESYQWRTLQKLEGEDYLKEIMTHVKIFTIDYTKKGNIAEYKIEPYSPQTEK